MVEITENKPQESSASNGIPREEILKRVSSIKDVSVRVEAARLSLQCDA